MGMSLSSFFTEAWGRGSWVLEDDDDEAMRVSFSSFLMVYFRGSLEGEIRGNFRMPRGIP